VVWNVAAGDDEDGGVDEERGGQRNGGIEEGELHRLALARQRLLVRRVCTTDEWRYRLCGITVAPRMPMPMYSISRSRQDLRGGDEAAATAAMSGREMMISNRKQAPMVAIAR